jgi:hypothetical protein
MQILDSPCTICKFIIYIIQYCSWVFTSETAEIVGKFHTNKVVDLQETVTHICVPITMSVDILSIWNPNRSFGTLKS